MLKPIVEQHHGAVELPLGQPASEMAIGADKDGNRRQRACQHLWLVPRVLDGFEYALAIAHHDNAIGSAATGVAAAQDRGPLTHCEQHASERRHDRRLAAAANGEIPDADDRAIETGGETAGGARTTSVADVRPVRRTR